MQSLPLREADEDSMLTTHTASNWPIIALVFHVRNQECTLRLLESCMGPAALAGAKSEHWVTRHSIKVS